VAFYSPDTDAVPKRRVVASEGVYKREALCVRVQANKVQFDVALTPEAVQRVEKVMPQAPE
jgi:hypothetical protein